jgi:hypothetical protein
LIEDQKAIIYDHNNYASNVAKAMLTYPEKFRNFDPKTFFEYIGLPVEERVQQVLSAISKGNSASDIAGNQAAQEQQRNRWTPAQLFQQRCGNCCQCKLKDCGRCESCRHNNDRTGLRQVCLRKVSMQAALFYLTFSGLMNHQSNVWKHSSLFLL